MKDLVQEIFKDIYTDIMPDLAITCSFNGNEFTAIKTNKQIAQVISLEGEAPEYQYSIIVKSDVLETMPQKNDRVTVGNDLLLVIDTIADPLGGTTTFNLGYQYA
ncbi:hypothetical protein P0Y35_11785 [Kiritimatiellaeota bacterium B1221]|nr:hypothetical protein [Kiritimatiellaeota bacterium B1221]